MLRDCKVSTFPEKSCQILKILPVVPNRLNLIFLNLLKYKTSLIQISHIEGEGDFQHNKIAKRLRNATESDFSVGKAVPLGTTPNKAVIGSGWRGNWKILTLN